MYLDVNNFSDKSLDINSIKMTGIDQCEDFMMFQRALTQLRGLDDKVRVQGENESEPGRFNHLASFYFA